MPYKLVHWGTGALAPGAIPDRSDPSLVGQDAWNADEAGRDHDTAIGAIAIGAIAVGRSHLPPFGPGDAGAVSGATVRG